MPTSLVTQRIVFGLLTLLVATFAVLEARRWSDDAYKLALTKSQRGRRIVGIALLLIVGAMGFGGSFLPEPKAHVSAIVKAWEMVYWGVCFLVAVAIPVVGYLEAKETLIQINKERKAAYRETLLASDQVAANREAPGE